MFGLVFIHSNIYPFCTVECWALRGYWVCRLGSRFRDRGPHSCPPKMEDLYVEGAARGHVWSHQASLLRLYVITFQPLRGKRPLVPAGKSLPGRCPYAEEWPEHRYLPSCSSQGVMSELRGSEHIWDLTSFVSLSHAKMFLYVILIMIFPTFPNLTS